jgi:hypothetical protein
MQDGILSNEVMYGVCCGNIINKSGVLVISLITGIVLLILAFSSLEATEYGLDYSWISKSVITNLIFYR